MLGPYHTNAIYHMEAIEGMKQIPDQSIDMILCDLPYEVTRNHWDILINLEDLWKEYRRIIKENGAIVLFGQGMFTSKLMYSNSKWWRYNLIWEKDRPSGFLNAKRMPLRSHEDIIVFYKKLPTYHPQFWEGKPLHGMGNKFKEGHLSNNNYGKFPSHTNPSANRKGDTTKFPRSVISIPKEHPPLFPTQKPVALCEWLIKTYTNENEIVLDSCMGSGSTALACIKSNRQYVGFELNKDHYDLSQQRVEEFQKTK